MYVTLKVLFDFALVYEPGQDMFVDIALSSNEVSGKSAHMRRLAREFAARIYKVWMQMKAQSKL